MNQIQDRIETLTHFVTLLFGDSSNQQAIEEANNWICEWLQTDLIFEDFCVLLTSFDTNFSSPDYQKVLFVTLKALQEKIRYGFENFSKDLIKNILELCWNLIEKVVNSPLHLRYVMLIICDIFSLTGEVDYKIIDNIPKNIKMTFFALFFENSQENFLKQYSIEVPIQAQLIMFGIQMLEETPTSVEWFRIALALLPEMDRFQSFQFTKLIPRFYESLSDIEMIRIMVNIMMTIYAYPYSIDQIDMLLAFFKFTICYSADLRQMIMEINDNDSKIELLNLLYIFWEGFFQIDCCELTVATVFHKPVLEIVHEFFNVCALFPSDTDVWSYLLTDILKFFETFRANHPISELYPMLYQLFIHAFDIGIPIESITELASTLHTLPVFCLEEYLIQLQQKTPGSLIVAACNIEYLSKEFVSELVEYITTSDDIPHFITLIFIENSFNNIDTLYLKKFLLFIHHCFLQLPQQSAKIFYEITKDQNQLIMKEFPQTFHAFSHFLQIPDIQTLIYLIPGLLNLVNAYDSVELCQSIGTSLINQCISVVSSNDTNQICVFLNYLIQITSHFPKKNEMQKDSLLSQFYRSLINSICQQLKSIYLLPEPTLQEYLGRFFIYIIDEEYISDLSYFTEYIELIAQHQEIVRSIHLVLASRLPLDACPSIMWYMKFIEPDNSTTIN